MKFDDIQSRFRELITRFIAECDGAELSQFIVDNPALREIGDGEYPFAHRIQDMVLMGQTYRLMRIVSPQERLFVAFVGKFSPSPGVPLELTGDRLQAWAKFENVCPQKDLTDWSEWLTLDLSKNYLRLVFTLDDDGLRGDVFCDHEKWIELRKKENRLLAEFHVLREVATDRVGCDQLIELLSRARSKLQGGS